MIWWKGDMDIMFEGWGLGSAMAYGGFGWVGLIFNLIIFVGLIIGFVLLVILLIRSISRHGNAPESLESGKTKELSPVEILQARYARGEINRKQYQEILDDLKK
jgi:putative membrane protein